MISKYHHSIIEFNQIENSN